MSDRWLITDDEDRAMQGLSVDAQVIYMRVLRRYMNFTSAVSTVTYGQMKVVLEYIPDRGSKLPPRRVKDIDNNFIRARIAELVRAGLIEVLNKKSRFDTPSYRCIKAPAGEVRPKKEPQRNHKEGATGGETRGEQAGVRVSGGSATAGATEEPQERNHKISGSPVENLTVPNLTSACACGQDNATVPTNPAQWSAFWMDHGFQHHQAVTVSLVRAAAGWIEQKASFGDMHLAMEVAHAKLGGRPDSPAYYRNFLHEVLREKENPTWGPTTAPGSSQPRKAAGKRTVSNDDFHSKTYVGTSIDDIDWMQ